MTSHTSFPPGEMITLAIDTAATHGSLALFNSKKIFASAQWQKTGSHSEFITLQMQKLLVDYDLKLTDISRLAVNIGPGSFTGIRVGINFARALAMSFQLPIFTCNSLNLLAHQVFKYPQFQNILCAQLAFGNWCYVSQCNFNNNSLVEVTPPTALKTDDLASFIVTPTLVLGSAYTWLEKQLTTETKPLLLRHSSMRDYTLAQDFESTHANDESLDQLTSWIHTIPLYVRASEAEEKLKAGLLKPTF